MRSALLVRDRMARGPLSAILRGSPPLLSNLVAKPALLTANRTQPSLIPPLGRESVGAPLLTKAPKGIDPGAASRSRRRPSSPIQGPTSRTKTPQARREQRFGGTSVVKKRASTKPYRVTYLLEGQALLSPKVHFGIRNSRKMHRLGVMAHRSEMTRAKI